MWRSLLTDLESVLKGAKPADLIRVPKAGPASRGEDAAAPRAAVKVAKSWPAPCTRQPSHAVTASTRLPRPCS